MRIASSACGRIVLILTLVVSVLTGRSLAGDVSDEKTITVPPIEESWIHGDIGVESSNQYIDRGYIYESKGLITQPYLDLVNVPQIRAARRNELVYQGGFRLDF
jgi:hypothetical protein